MAGGTAVQAGRSRAEFPMGSFRGFIVAVRSTQRLTEMTTSNFPGGGGVG